ALLHEPWSNVVSVSLGILVVVTTGLRRVYNWRDTWVRYTGACVDLATASVKYRYKVEPFDDNEVPPTYPKRDQRLVERVREIEEAESRGWMASSTTHSAETKPGSGATQ